MTVEGQNGHDERTDDIGINDELGKLTPSALLTIDGMAHVFGKSPNTILRAVEEERLPQPFRIFSGHCWRAGEVDAFLQQRICDAQNGARERRRPADPEAAPAHLKPLRKGDSPIRSEKNAGNT